MSAAELITQLKSIKVVAILRKYELQEALRLSQCLVESGVKAIEVTMEHRDAVEIIHRLRGRYGRELCIGAGTVMGETDVRNAVEAGADVLFSPHLDLRLLEYSKQSGRVLIPGVATPTEVAMAKNAGASMLKLFPAGSLGPSYLKDLLGPFSGTDFIATGGITGENAAEYLRSGAAAVGMGSALFPKNVDGMDTDKIQEYVENVLADVIA